MIAPTPPLPSSGATSDTAALEGLTPDALRLMTLALHANGRLDMRTLSALLELLMRGAWTSGFRQALGQRSGGASGGALCGLSPREMAVLRLVAIGRNNQEIGRALSISRNTVASHLRAIMSKTFTANRTEAAAFAYREGLLAPPRATPPWTEPISDAAARSAPTSAKSGPVVAPAHRGPAD